MDKSTIDKSNDDIIGQKDRQRRDGDGRQKVTKNGKWKILSEKYSKLKGPSRIMGSQWGTIFMISLSSSDIMLKKEEET